MTYSSCSTSYSKDYYNSCDSSYYDTVVIACDDFGGICKPQDSYLIAYNDCWQVKNNALYADGYSDGWLVTGGYNVQGATTLTFDIKTLNIDPFECDDVFSVAYTLDGCNWYYLDQFTRHGDNFVGNLTGQSYGECSTSISYTVGNDSTSFVQFAFLADFSYCDETVIMDNLCITEDVKVEVCKPEVNVTEFFSNICDPAQATLVKSDDCWKIKNGAAYADGGSDGALVFNAIDVNGQSTISFDVKTQSVSPFESNDTFTVYINTGSGWVKMDTFTRCGSVFKGNITGQTYATSSTKISYTVGDETTDTVQLKLVANFSACDETVIVDNVNFFSAAVDCKDPADASLWGRYFVDANYDNTEYGAAGWEAGVAGATVTLIKVEGGVETVVGTTTTTEGGDYNFADLEAGDYYVTFAAPDTVAGYEGWAFVAANQGGDGEDSDVIASNGKTAVFSIAESEHKVNVDAGITDGGCGSLGGRYFLDTNNDDTEYDAAGGWEAGVADATVWLIKVVNGVETVVGSTTTDDSGTYSFDTLGAGTYYVSFQEPTDIAGYETYAFVTANVGGDGEDSDAVTGGKTDTFVLGANQHLWNIDAGIEYVDPATAAISGRYFVDANNNDVDDAEAGVAGVTVTLTDAAGTVIATTATLADGSYSFTDLVAGDYTVTFGADPEGYVLVAQNIGSDDTIDSDVGADRALTVSLAAGEVSTDNDAGVEDPATGSIAGRVFVDANGNDVDDSEAGLGGIEVILTDTVTGATVTTTTLVDGSYSFTDLVAGDYTVTFGADPEGRVLVAQDQGSDDTIDSDADATGTTGTISLAIGETVSDVDAGMEDPATASVGNFVFYDENENGVFDGSDYALEGVDVALKNAAGTVVATQTTDANGAYSFTGLTAGTYSVAFAALAGMVFTTQSAAADLADNDSDADASGLTDTFILSIGEAETKIDAGLYIPNEAPVAADDAAMTCSDETATVAVLANDVDPDGDSADLVITAVDGQAITEGASITTAAGTVVTLVGDELVIDGSTAYAGLDIGEQAVEAITYTVMDADGATDDGQLDMTFCGDANSIQSLFDSLPSDAIVFQVADGLKANPFADFGYDLLIASSTDARFDGVVFEQAYCLNYFEIIPTDVDFTDADSVTGAMMSTDEAVAGGLFDASEVSHYNGLNAADNMDLINWIVAQDFENNATGSVDGGFGAWEVQFAIWELTCGFPSQAVINATPSFGSYADVLYILEQASQHEGFTYTDEDIVGVVVTPSPVIDGVAEQPFIVAVSVEDYDCFC